MATQPPKANCTARRKRGFPRTDAGNAEFFGDHYKDQLRYDFGRGRWLIWAKHWWIEDRCETVLQLAKSHDVPVVETTIPRELLYIADELFFSGTAAEITPVRSVDRIPVGKGKRGPITERLQRDFFNIVEGKSPDRHGWLTPVALPVAVTS